MASSNKAPIVGVYARLSKLKGRDDSIETQVKLATEEARRRWSGANVRVYKDPDVSAADPTKVRPDFLRLVGDIARGEVRQVIASDQERLTRQPAEWEMLIQALRSVGIDATYGYRDGRTGVRLGETAAGRYKVVGAVEYVDGIRVKVLEKLQANADRGQPSGGRYFGYQRVTVSGVKTLVFANDEVAIIERILADVRAGKTLRSVAQWLYDEGIPAPKGGKHWAITSIRNLVTSPHLAGLLTRQVREEDEDGVLSQRTDIVPGNWDGLITPEERDDLVDTMSARTLKSPRVHARKYVLSGVLRCTNPRCEEAKMGGGGSHQEYRCRWCGRSIAAVKTERYVIGLLLPRIDALNRLLSLTDDQAERRGELLADLARIERQRKTYGELLAEEEMDVATYQAARQRLAEKERAARVELDSLPAPVTRLTTSRAARQGFAAMSIAEQSALCEQYIERVDVRPAEGRRRWSADRLDVVSRVPVQSEAARLLLAGRREFVERTGGTTPDLALASRFVALADIEPTPEAEAAHYAAKFTEQEYQIGVEQVEAERTGTEHPRRA